MLMVAGGIGAVSRYGVSKLFPFTGSEFPTATVVCNLSGSLLLAVLVGRYATSHPQLVLVLGTGLLGAWTTYSTFSLEMVRLAEAGEVGRAGVYAGVTLMGGALLSALGWWIGLQLRSV
jgi:CrcB protein